MKELLSHIVDTLKSRRVEYGDVRIVERENEYLSMKSGVIEGIVRDTSIGFGVRVIKDSAWGFCSSNRLTKQEANSVVRRALEIASASVRVKGAPVQLSELDAQRGDYRSTVTIDPFTVSLEDKIGHLLECDRILRQDPRVKVSTAYLRFSRYRQHFASTEGSRIHQEIVFSGGGIRAFAIDQGELQTRSYEDIGQAGYEFVNDLQLVQHAPRVAEEVLILLAAKPCPAMTTDLVLDSSQMVLQVHESCGHPTELDRVLGTEASYAGTSFMTIDKLRNLKYGSDQVNIVADATVPGGLGTFGWDDEGVPAQRVDLVKDGMFVGYLTSRETAPIVNARSSGAMRADGWNRIPLIRMTNINLVPGDRTLEEMIADTEDGVYLTTNKSWSIDDKRLNFQFGCELARRIAHGKLTEVYRNPTYADITPKFWNKCDAVGNQSTWHLYGVPNCGKGEPGQTMSVGHGTAPARFRGVPVGIAR